MGTQEPPAGRVDKSTNLSTTPIWDLGSGINKILSSVLRINKMAIGLALLCRSCPNPEGFESLIPGLPLLYLCRIIAII